MIEPVSDAFTRSTSPRRSAKIVMISSAAFPNVAFRRPPSPGPMRAAACSVARPIQPASGSSESAEAASVSPVRRVEEPRRRPRPAGRGAGSS